MKVSKPPTAQPSIRENQPEQVAKLMFNSDLLLDQNHDIGRPTTLSSLKDSHHQPPSTMHKQPGSTEISAAKYTRLHGHDQTDSNTYLHHGNLLQPEMFRA